MSVIEERKIMVQDNMMAFNTKRSAHEGGPFLMLNGRRILEGN